MAAILKFLSLFLTEQKFYFFLFILTDDNRWKWVEENDETALLLFLSSATFIEVCCPHHRCPRGKSGGPWYSPSSW